MNREKFMLFCTIILISFFAITAVAVFTKPEQNKTVILRLIK